MKRLLFILGLCATICKADLTPDSFTFTWTRSEETAYGDTNTWFTGVTYLLTNNIIMDSASVTQDLTNIGVEIRAGNNTTNLLYRGTVTDAANGTFSCFFTFPSPNSKTDRGMVVYLQLSMTNGAGIRVTYKGQKQYMVVNPLQ